MLTISGSKPDMLSMPDIKPDMLGMAEEANISNMLDMPDVKQNTISMQDGKPNTTNMSDVKPNLISMLDIEPETLSMPDGKTNLLSKLDLKPNIPSMVDVKPNVLSTQDAKPSILVLDNESNVSIMLDVKPKITSKSDVGQVISNKSDGEVNAPNVPDVEPRTLTASDVEPQKVNKSGADKELEHSSRKRKVFTIGDKILIIRDLESGKSQSKLARELNIQQSTVSRMWKNRSKIISAYENDQVKSKRLRYSACKSMVSSHTNGLILPKKPGLYITGPMPVLQPKLQELSQIPLQMQQPLQGRPTDSWLQRFAVKHSIIISDVTGQTLVPVSTSFTPNPDWLSTVWFAMRKDYADHNIFHVDETGLFFRLTPEKTMTCLGEHCFGGKLASERVTVVLCTNMTGSEKRRLLVIGKNADPQLFATIDKWPLKYAANSKAWMTSEIFESELREWDLELQSKNRHILLLVSDCSAHPRVPNLKHIKLVYLPYHVASVRQPMGRGIFRSFKTQYRRLLMLQLIDRFEEHISTAVTLLDALRMLYKAWLRVPVEMIKNCFLQTGLMKAGNEGNVFDEFEDDIPLSLWLSNHSFTQFDTWKETIDWYVEADSELQTSEEPEEKDVQCEEGAAEGSESSSDESVEGHKETEENFINEAISATEALCALRKVSKFFEQESASSKLSKVITMEATLEKMILSTQLAKESM